MRFMRIVDDICIEITPELDETIQVLDEPEHEVEAHPAREEILEPERLVAGEDGEPVIIPARVQNHPPVRELVAATYITRPAVITDFYPDGLGFEPYDGVAEPGQLREGGGWITPPPPPVDLIAHARQRRWQAESGGLNVGGVHVLTDDRAKLMLIGARIKAMITPEGIEHWAAADGQVHALTGAQIIGISDAVAAHTSACFTRFAAVIAAIEIGAIASASDVDAAFMDVGDGWMAGG